MSDVVSTPQNFTVLHCQGFCAALTLLCASWSFPSQQFDLNAGADIVLGMLPLAREFLRQGVEVVLCANTLPAINDVTAQELCDLVEKIGSLCPVIKVCTLSQK